MQHGMATKCACGSFRSGKLLHALLRVYFLGEHGNLNLLSQGVLFCYCPFWISSVVRA